MAASPTSSGDEDSSDMEALRRACTIAGKSLSDAEGYSGGESSDSEDDLDLLRSIQQRFSLPSTAEAPLTLKPLNFVLPTDSEDEDFETLRAIRRRFSQYDSDSKTTKNNGESSQDAVGIQSSTSEKEDDRNAFPKSFEAEDGLGHFSSTRFTDSRPPFCGKNFVDALRFNRSCQRIIRNKLIEIEARIESIKELKKRARYLMDFESVSRKRTGRISFQKRDPRVQLISLPKKRLSSKAMSLEPLPLCHGPAENPHVSIYKKVSENFLSLSRKKKWSKVEKENLMKGIKQQYKERAFLGAMELSSDPGGVNEKSLVAFMNNNEFSTNDLRFFLPMVNWNRLASMYLPGHSGAECESRWWNQEDPAINKNPWTSNEEKRLLQIIQTRGIYDWIEISVLLGTHRTPFQCLVRYQRSLNPHTLKKDWTEDEDSRLLAAVETHGKGDWQLIASCLEGRTGQQCSIRWRNSLHPCRKKVGRWSIDEDKHLKVAVLLFGAKNWSKLAHFVPGRTQSQCRERWVNCLDPALKLEAWSEEEDTRLREAISLYGYSWTKVASFVTPRTDNQCRRRWKVLFPDEVILHQAACKVQKKFLITNFVDRTSERRLIGPHDFYFLQRDAQEVLFLEGKVDRGDKIGKQDQKNASKRRERRLDNHERETVSKKREKGLDQVTGARSKTRRKKALDKAAESELGVDHERETVPKKREEILNQVTETEGSSHDREIAQEKREKGLERETEAKGTKRRKKMLGKAAEAEVGIDHERETVPRKRGKGLDQVTAAEGANHESETVPEKREKGLDQVTEAKRTYKRKKRLDKAVEAEVGVDHRRKTVAKKRGKWLEGTKHERETVLKKREKGLGKVTETKGTKGRKKKLDRAAEAEVGIDCERETVPKKRNKRLDQVSEMKGTNHERETARKKREKRLDHNTETKCTNRRKKELGKSAEVQTDINHERENVPKKREKTLDCLTEAKIAKRRKKLGRITEAEVGADHERETLPKKRVDEVPVAESINDEGETLPNKRVDEVTEPESISDERETIPDKREDRLDQVFEAQSTKSICLEVSSASLYAPQSCASMIMKSVDLSLLDKDAGNLTQVHHL